MLIWRNLEREQPSGKRGGLRTPRRSARGNTDSWSCALEINGVAATSQYRIFLNGKVQGTL